MEQKRLMIRNRCYSEMVDSLDVFYLNFTFQSKFLNIKCSLMYATAFMELYKNFGNFLKGKTFCFILISFC